MATVKRAYRFALAPSPPQERMLRSHAGAARFAWNWGLAQCKERYRAERKWYSAAELHRLWNAEKKANPALAWWAENSKCAYQEAFRNLDRALLPRRQWGGEAKRARSGGKTRHGRAHRAETRTRHPRQAGQDRDRRPARDGCGMSTLPSTHPQRIGSVAWEITTVV